MISITVNNRRYATNDYLSGLFVLDGGAYTQLAGTLDLEFASERDFEKYVVAQATNDAFESGRYPDVTRSGRFVWRKLD